MVTDLSNNNPGIASGVNLVAEASWTNFIRGQEANIITRKASIFMPFSTTYKAGTVLGQITVSTAPTSAPVGGNVGNGTLGTITTGPGVTPGNYLVRITTASTNGGAYILRSPAGVQVGTGAVGTPFSGAGLGFTLSDGSTDFAVNDSFTITVPAGSGAWTRADAAATDGP